MEKYYRIVFTRSLAILGGVLLLIVAFSTLPARAQSGCTGDPCVFNTPTPTPTGAPTPTPGAGTPTAVPMPQASPFPRPNYGVPTSIPDVSLPGLPSPVAISFPTPGATLSITLPQPETITGTATGWAMPSPISMTSFTAPAAISLTVHATVTPVPMTGISSSLAISATNFMTLTVGSAATRSYTLTNYFDSGLGGVISGTISYTTYLSGELQTIQGTDQLTLTAAPDWYAPSLPRDMASVGWTFEQVGADSTARYSVANWAYLLGQIIVMPIHLARVGLDIFWFMGPFKLFLIWLIVIILPAVLGLNLLTFIGNMIVKMFGFVNWLLDWIWKLWEAIPFVN